ncbi:hypothetical protein HMN09_00808300 [Mycena chlorophos]|uniref:Golgi apparatus membrane protein TVP38 n=1 Tax=Mycena chlorophos TaxID=658473 RepID=A0A8H6SUD9_MYCCL|nr:hypothetical protein HMN09_00808300 [Mycena chlorophos]
MSSAPELAMPQPKVAMGQHAYPPEPSVDPSPAPPYSTFRSDNDNATIGRRDIIRTPSPTPSESDLLNGVRPKQSRQATIRRLAIIAFIVVIVVLIEVYHTQIINALKPVTNWLHGVKGGWVIPILVLIVLSFPPLFGHELVLTLCGLVWGVGEGFGIGAAGTLLGEIITYWVFAYWCFARAAKAEEKNLRYALLAHTIRKGGLVIAIVVRYSTLPGHLTTAIFATCGMPFWIFLVAAVVSLPKQFAIVYVGYALGTSGNSKSSHIQSIVIGVTTPITVVAMLYLRWYTKKVTPGLVYERRKARQAKMLAELDAEVGASKPTP